MNKEKKNKKTDARCILCSTCARDRVRSLYDASNPRGAFLNIDVLKPITHLVIIALWFFGGLPNHRLSFGFRTARCVPFLYIELIAKSHSQIKPAQGALPCSLLHQERWIAIGTVERGCLVDSILMTQQQFGSVAINKKVRELL
jgi:hypothetical protein